MGELRVEAPFTDAQVLSLNRYQISGVMHEFTCGGECRDKLGTNVEGRHTSRPLVATVNGWICPTCDYTQTWAWGWMADFSWEGMGITSLANRGGWQIEELIGGAFLLTPQGTRVAKMTRARARGIAAALNTGEGAEAFLKARNEG